MTVKPPYQVPSMVDVAKVRGSNGYKVVSTFSGCGGACLGLEMAGFEIVWANEFVEEARNTYRENHPGVIVDGRDIRDVKGSEILDATGLAVGELDLFEGSPPCASFSTAGSREKGWGRVKSYSDTTQRADDLFFEYGRLLGELQPKVFTAENVSGLVKGKAVGYFKEILVDLRSKGYAVEAKVLDASWLGVPQARQRLIFVGVRNDLVDKYGIRPAHPKPWAYRYAIRDAIDVTDQQTVDAETGMDITFARYAIGPEWAKLLPGQSSEKYFQLVKPSPRDPVGTITATGGSVGAASVTHPTQARKFTLAELRLLSSFPRDFSLTGSFEQRWERIGRSVPPFMSRAIGEAIRDEILGRIHD